MSGLLRPRPLQALDVARLEPRRQLAEFFRCGVTLALGLSKLAALRFGHMVTPLGWVSGHVIHGAWIPCASQHVHLFLVDTGCVSAYGYGKPENAHSRDNHLRML